MTNPPEGATPDRSAGEREVSLLMLLSFALRWRRAIVGTLLLGFVIGATAARLKDRMYLSSATFLTQAGEGANTGLAAAASLFGIRSGSQTGAGAWGPRMYVQVLQTRSVLEAIALDTITVAEDGGQRVLVMDELEAAGETPAERMEDAVQTLREIVRAEGDDEIGAVSVRVVTPKPSVSHALALRALQAVNDFNLKTRKSQASAERVFVEQQALEAAVALRAAEQKLLEFMERNVSTISPRLTVEHNRLQREVDLRQQVLTSLEEAREQARSREVRDTPVITLLESPRVPVRAEARGTVKMALFGAIFGAMLGVLFALAAEMISRARRGTTVEERELYEVIKAATPRRLRRAWP